MTKKQEQEVKDIIESNMNWLEEMITDRMTDLLFMEYKVKYKDKVERVDLIGYAREIFFRG